MCVYVRDIRVEGNLIRTTHLETYTTLVKFTATAFNFIKNKNL